MATYRYSQYLLQNNHAAFDAIHSPGTVPPYSGIYRCLGCGREVVAEQSRQLPPQNHHQHSPARGQVRWRLIVYADHEPK
jgi:hypothetical protein